MEQMAEPELQGDKPKSPCRGKLTTDKKHPSELLHEGEVNFLCKVTFRGFIIDAEVTLNNP